MKLYSDESLRNFEFWSGAADRVKYLTDDELDSIESQLEDLYPDGVGATELNDIFWFDEEFIASCLGYDSFEDIINRDDDDEDEDDKTEEDDE